MQGGPGRALRNDDLLQVGVVRLEKAFALAIHPNPARHKIGLTRLNVAVAFNPRDAAGLFEFAQRGLQFLLAVGRQPKKLKQFRHVRRHVFFSSEEADDLFFHQ